VRSCAPAKIKLTITTGTYEIRRRLYLVYK
jgi:hypothetical protein